MSEANKMDKLILNGQNIDLSPDYQNIRNKPKINGVTVDGNKTLDDFGVATKQEVENVSEKVAKLPYGIYYGQYNDVESLPDVSQLTQKGYAYVASTDPSIFYIYTYDGEGNEWQDSGNKFDSGSLENNLNTKSQTKAPTTKAVKDGIDAIDVTKMQNVQPVVAALNDRAADVDQQTSAVKALGYKVLNPVLSFAEQVENVVENDVLTTNNSNTIFEIRDFFDLNNGNVTIPTGAVLKFNGGKLKNGTISFGDCTIDAPITQIFENCVILDASTSQDIHTTWFGMSPTATNNAAILESLCNSFRSILVDAGEYPMERAVTIGNWQNTAKVYRVRGISSLIPRDPKLVFTDTSGLIIKQGVSYLEIDGLNLIGTPGTWDDETQKYDANYIGIDIVRDCIVKNCTIKGFSKGISFENGSISNCEVANATIESCGNYGIYQYSYGEGSTIMTTNNTNIHDCYITGIGHGGGGKAANFSINSTEFVSGHGIYIRGGSSCTYNHNVVEYCSGIGIFVDSPRAVSGGIQQYLHGCVITNNHLEHNKYANMLVNLNYTNNSILSGLVIYGNRFSDSNSTLPTNIIELRTIVVLNRYARSVNSNKIYIQDAINSFTTKNRLSISNLVDSCTLINVQGIQSEVIMSGTTYDTISNIDVDDKALILLKAGVNPCTDRLAFEIPITLSKGVYNVVANMKAAAFCRVTISYSIGGVAKTFYWNPSNGNANAYADYLHDTKLVLTADSTITFKAAYKGSAASTDAVYLKSITFTPITSGTYASRPNSAEFKVEGMAGFEYWCTDLRKKIVWNGEAWSDAKGEVVGLQVDDTSILLSATAASSQKTINVISASAVTAVAQNSDGTTTDCWLTASEGTASGGKYPITLEANSDNDTSNPRGAKVILTNGTDVEVINVVQNYSAS